MSRLHVPMALLLVACRSGARASPSPAEGATSQTSDTSETQTLGSVGPPAPPPSSIRDARARAKALCAWFERTAPGGSLAPSDAAPETRAAFAEAAQLRRCVIDPPGAWAIDVRDVTAFEGGFSARVEAVRLDEEGPTPRQRRVVVEPWPDHCEKGRVCSTVVDSVRELTLRPIGDVDGDGQPDVELTGVLASHVCGDGIGTEPDDVLTPVRFHLGVKKDVLRWIPPPRR